MSDRERGDGSDGFERAVPPWLSVMAAAVAICALVAAALLVSRTGGPAAPTHLGTPVPTVSGAVANATPSESSGATSMVISSATAAVSGSAPAGPSPGATPQPTPPPSEPPATVLSWTRIPHPPGPSLAAGDEAAYNPPLMTARPGGGFLAVIPRLNSLPVPSETGATVQTSADGVHWSDSAQIAGTSDMWFDGVVWDGSRYALLETARNRGWPATNPPFVDATPYVFLSPDGRTWTRHLAVVADAPDQATSIAATRGHMVLVGWSRSARTLWSSVDGISWTASWPIDNRVAAVVAADGEFIAGGEDQNGAAIWRSSDGVAWSRASVETASEQGPIPAALVHSPVGDLAIGSNSTAAWTSTDGNTWKQAALSGRIGVVSGVVWARGMYIGIARDERFYPQIVSSADGRHWSAAAIPGTTNVSPASVCTDGRHVVIDIGNAYLVR